MSDKIDYKKELKQFYKVGKKPEIITVPSFNFLTINGVDARPESDNFQNAIQALFGVSYKAKFISKKELGKDYTVMPLEGLWWADDMDDFINGNKEHWQWTLMIFQPDFITGDIINEAIQVVKKKNANSALDKLRLDPYEEGLSAQILHVGPFSEEHENILKIHELIERNGGSFDGKVHKHHEIYLSDFRKTAPEKLRTIIRQPFIQ